MSLTKAEFEEIKFKLRQMRKSINKDNSIARMKSKGERVYQLNIQLFPVTNAIEGVVEKPAMTLAPSAPNLDIVVEEVPALAPAPVTASASVEPSATTPSEKEASEVSVTATNKPSNVSSLAATAASAADLFR